MFNLDEITQGLKDVKEAFEKNWPEIKEKINDLHEEFLGFSESHINELGFQNFMAISQFFFMPVDTGEKDANGNPIIKTRYNAEAHVNAYIACRQNYIAAITVTESEEEEDSND